MPLKNDHTKPLTAILVASAVIALTAAALAQSEGFPWDNVVGLNIEMLDDEARARVVELAEQTPNYYGCRGTVADCISRDAPDPTAARLAGFLARRVLEGLTDEEIAAAVAERRRSARPRLIAEIDVQDAPCVGAESALVTIVEFADFECPFCRISSPILETIARERSDRVRFCFKHFPIRTHPRGVPSSVAALAAHRQGRFWEMHDAVYSTAPDLSDGALQSAAETAELDLVRFNADIRDDALVEEVMADKYEGLELSVDRTPTIFINGKMYFGTLSAIELVDRIEEELEMIE